MPSRVFFSEPYREASPSSALLIVRRLEGAVQALKGSALLAFKFSQGRRFKGAVQAFNGVYCVGSKFLSRSSVLAFLLFPWFSPSDQDLFMDNVILSYELTHYLNG